MRHEFHCDINTKGAHGRNILLVTKYSCDLNALDDDGDTPFTCAGLGGSVECVELLINEFHCDINTMGSNGRSVVHNACENSHINLLRALVLKYSCDFQYVDTSLSNVQALIEKLKRRWKGMLNLEPPSMD